VEAEDRGDQGPIWAVAPLDGWMDGWMVLEYIWIIKIAVIPNCMSLM
jgi:hypothetical protein